MLHSCESSVGKPFYLIDDVSVGVRKASQGFGEHLLGLSSHLVKKLINFCLLPSNLICFTHFAVLGGGQRDQEVEDL